MCGIAGLHLRDSSLHPELGRLLDSMMCQAAERGVDASGVGVYGDPRLTPPGTTTVSVLGLPVPGGEAAAAVSSALRDTAVTSVEAGQTVTLSSSCHAGDLEAAVGELFPAAVVSGRGSQLAVVKGTGHPGLLSAAVGLATVSGWQAVSHTRMATESAVTPAGSHPFSVGPDQCLVHNGSFSNHATIRRELMAQGVVFDSLNDSEVGARFLAHQLAAGADLELALKLLCGRFDGFYTLLVTTGDSFAVVRDAIACKPAVIAETDRWVAMASEYRYLTALPGIEDARLFEPEPEQVYVWHR